MMPNLISFLRRIKLRIVSGMIRKMILRYYLKDTEKQPFLETYDPVRYGAIALALQTISRLKIVGALAEVGVYQGETSRIIRTYLPDRRFYLFDTFEGFPAADLYGRQDERFKDTNMEIVKKKIGDMRDVIFRKGYFPDTAQGLENETFSFVMADVHLYEPTLACLQFFYPRLAKGGYLFIHDFNSHESDFAVSKAVNEYFADKPEKLIELPDLGGSVLIRKI